MTEQAPVLSDLDRALAAVDPLVAGVRADQWSASTPCTEWDVRQLVDHIVAGNLYFTATLRGTPPPDRAGDHLGDDPLQAVRSSGGDMAAAFAAPGVLERTYETFRGVQPGSTLVHMRVNELLVHGWDLARATGQSTAGLPDDLAEEAVAIWTRSIGGRPRDGMPFADEQAAPDGAPAIDRLAAFLGRTP